MRIIYMGTPEFAAIALSAIVKEHEVVAVVTQPDKPQGRNRKLVPTPVKVKAQEYEIPVYQPEKVREAEMVETLRSYKPDAIVVAAYGQILPESILSIPPYGCINIHASLLPKYRGAAPIQWAVINGDRVSGVTTMRMDEGIDTGDIIEQAEYELAPDETGGSLFDHLAEVGADLCVHTMAEIEAGRAVYTRQDETLATHVGMLKKQFGKIDWTKPAEEIERLIRGLNPWPSAYTSLNGKTLKIWKASVQPGGDPADAGKIVLADKNSIGVQTGKDILILQEIQLEGKKRMSVDAFLRGFPVSAGTELG